METLYNKRENPKIFRQQRSPSRSRSASPKRDSDAAVKNGLHVYFGFWPSGKLID